MRGVCDADHTHFSANDRISSIEQPQRKELESRVRSRVLRADDVRRARLILMLAEGDSWLAIDGS
jgi:hypothetical protein